MYAVLDIESTGGKYNEEGITEIAIYRFDGNNVEDQFRSLVNPERQIQPFVAKLTGINNKMLRTAPKFHEVAKRIVEITENATLVAHNAQFDYRILRTEFRRLGYDFKRKTLCTVDLSKRLLPNAESHSLGKLVRSLGIPVTDRHRANGDALATLELFKILLTKDVGKYILKEIVRGEDLGELSPTQLDIVSELPSETGVYYMQNKDGELIYIDKTKNLKKRVNQHFINNTNLARKLQKETKKVNYELTGSELIALLKAHHEVKKVKPIHNSKRSEGFSHGVYKHVDSNGRFVLRAERAKGQPNRLTSFKSLSACKNFISKIAEDFGIDTNDSHERHNQKVDQIFKKYSIDQRSFILVDKGRHIGEQAVVVIKNGFLKGFAYTELNHQVNNWATVKKRMTPITHDKATIHILEAYLRKNNRLKFIEDSPYIG